MLHNQTGVDRDRAMQENEHNIDFIDREIGGFDDENEGLDEIGIFWA